MLGKRRFSNGVVVSLIVLGLLAPGQQANAAEVEPFIVALQDAFHFADPSAPALASRYFMQADEADNWAYVVSHWREQGAEELRAINPARRQPSTRAWSAMAQWMIRINTKATKITHVSAETVREFGEAPFRTHAHAALIRASKDCGSSVEDPDCWYGGTQVFSAFTHSCARSEFRNGDSRSCQSPDFATKTGDRWVIVSGHWYDDRDDGHIDDECAGCIDKMGAIPPAAPA